MVLIMFHNLRSFIIPKSFIFVPSLSRFHDPVGSPSFRSMSPRDHHNVLPPPPLCSMSPRVHHNVPPPLRSMSHRVHHKVPPPSPLRSMSPRVHHDVPEPPPPPPPPPEAAAVELQGLEPSLGQGRGLRLEHRGQVRVEWYRHVHIVQDRRQDSKVICIEVYICKHRHRDIKTQRRIYMSRCREIMSKRKP